MEKEKKNHRKIQALETRDKIYNIANQLFREHGFEKVSVDSIVELAGVSKGAFYVHFDSKDALIAALLSDFVKEVDLDYKSYLQSLPAKASASDILYSLVEKIADVITCTIGYHHMQTVYKVQITKTVNTDAVMGYTREIYQMFNEIISKGVEQGEFRTDLPVDTIAKHFMLALRGLTYEWCIRYPDFDLKDQAVKHFQILLTGIEKQ